MKDLSTQGDNNITITEGVDGGLVDVALEGNTLVNVSKTKDSTAITKAYTVENSGNHVALEGDADGSCRLIITGNTLVNIIQSFSDNSNQECDFSTGSYKATADGTGQSLRYPVNAKTNTKYTVIANIKTNTLNNNFALVGWNITAGNKQATVPRGFTGLFISVITTRESNLDNLWSTDLWQENTEGEIEVSGFMILEGDYTNKPIPDYFTGLQSSFEDNLVTQEMVDNGEEVADNLGKYKVEYKVTGEDGTVGSTKTLYLNSPLLEGDTIEEKDGGIYHVHRYRKANLVSDFNWTKDNKYFRSNSNSSIPSSKDGMIYCDKIQKVH